MKLPQFRKKKTLDKVSEGELKILRAELEHQEALLEREITELNSSVRKQLASCAAVQTETKAELLSRELENLSELKKDAVQRKLTVQNKRHATIRLLHLKQEAQMKSRKNSVIDVIDIDSIISHQEAVLEQKDVESMRLERILENSRTGETYAKISAIVHAVRTSSCSVEDAEKDIERLTLEQLYQSDSGVNSFPAKTDTENKSAPLEKQGGSKQKSNLF